MTRRTRPATQLGALLGCLAISACRSDQTSGAVAACDHIFNVLYVQCAQAAPPADEVVRLRQRYELTCQRGLALPGIAVTPAQLTACANQVAADCRLSGALGACLQPGTLGSDASCSDSLQCQSNSCSKPFLFLADSGTSEMLACGSCEPVIPVGQPCGGSVQGQCAPGTSCDFASGPTCAPPGELGATCTPGSSRGACKASLLCDPSSGTCTVPGNAGARCVGTAACAYPLACTGTPSRTCVSPGHAAANCTQDSDCVQGLACDSTSSQCVMVTWARGGQPCSDTARCLVGDCPTGTAGAKCPQVIPDGQPCSAQNPAAATCDAFASCVDGICSLGAGSNCP